MGKTFYVTKDVEVEIDEDDLEEAGYHHEDDCPARMPGGSPYHHEDDCPARMPGGSPDLTGVLQSLHEQAHPKGPREIFGCREEPCRSLGLSQIGY